MIKPQQQAYTNEVEQLGQRLQLYANRKQIRKGLTSIALSAGTSQNIEEEPQQEVPLDRDDPLFKPKLKDAD